MSTSRWGRVLSLVPLTADGRRNLRRGVRRRSVGVLDATPAVARPLIALLNETSSGRAALTERAYPPAGHALAGRDPDLLPVALVLVWGASPQDAQRVVEQIVGVQKETAGFRPVLVFDEPHLGVTRGHGLLGELVVPESAWDLVEQRESWTDYAQERIRGLIALYHATITLMVEDGQLSDADRFLLQTLRDGRREAPNDPEDAPITRADHLS